jgi:hypothetical protein
MKKNNLMALIMFLTLSASPVFAAKSGNTANTSATTTETENRLTTEEVNAMTSRVIEIRDMDKSDLSAAEKTELKNELKEIKATMKSDPYIYIGGSTLVIIIVLLILLR